MHNLTEEVYKYCQKEKLLIPGMRVIAGVSGGADSVCLLRVLKEMDEILKLDIRCVHIEHGIRGAESCRDMDFVKKLCERLNVPLKVFQVDVPTRAAELSMTVEEAGRHIRYETFQKEAKNMGADVIAVAHHQNDQAETVLFNLIRGSGLKGVSGMESKRGNIIRPLLNVTRGQIEDYLRAIGQDYCIDSTNADTVYARNCIRSLVLPEFEKIVKGAAGHIARAADEIREADEYIRAEAMRVNALTVTVNDINAAGSGRCSDKIYRIDIDSLSREAAIIQRYVIRSVLTDIYTTHKDLEALHVNDVLSLAGKQSGRIIMLPKGVTAKRENGYIIIGRSEVLSGKKKLVEEVRLNIGRDTIIGGFGILRADIEDYDGSDPPDTLYTKWFDYDKIINTVFVRGRREGDFLISDADGHRKKLKKYLIDEKVPALERDSLILLADGEHVIWVIGMRISEHYKICNSTKRVLKVTYDKAKI